MASSARRVNYLRFGLAVSKPTLNELPLKSLPSSPEMAARASCPSIPIKPKPLHWSVKMSVISFDERTVPN